MTVSNAYNRPDQLSAMLRERVLEKARELGYPGPDPLARGLRRGRASALGVLYDTWPAFVFQDAAMIQFLQGLSTALQRAFMGLLLVPGPGLDRGDTPSPLDGALVDGFVVYSVADTDPQVASALHRRPTVIVDQPKLEGVAFVGIDDRAAARAAAEHLLALGHHRIAVITFALRRDGTEGPAGPARQQEPTYAVTRERLAGYRQALTSAGVAWEEVVVYECPGSSPHLGHRAAEHLLGAEPRPTALLATSDALAIGALSAARELSIRIPTELSLIGFDDTPAAQNAQPALTTIRQPHQAKGRHAGQLLLELVDNQAPTAPTILETQLVIRSTTAPPPQAV